MGRNGQLRIRAARYGTFDPAKDVPDVVWGVGVGWGG